MPDYSRYTQHQIEEEMLQELLALEHNPPTVRSLIKVPDEATEEWKIFFEKVITHQEIECLDHRHTLLSLKSRYERMVQGHVSEFGMLRSAQRIKEKGNEEFVKGNFRKAEIIYRTAIRFFPTPDAMNNMAACLLKLHEYKAANQYATMALETGLLTSTNSIVKAHIRRASALKGLGMFEDALKDLYYARTLNVSDYNQSLDENIQQILHLIGTINTESELVEYLSHLPNPVPQLPLSDALMIQKTLEIRGTTPREDRHIATRETPPVY